MKEILKPVAVLVAICLIITAALAGVNALTKGPISANEAVAAEAAMAELIPDAEYESVWGDGFQCEQAYAAVKGDDEVGYIFTSSAIGYGGKIKVMTALDNEGTVLGIQVLSCDDETPGLGQNVKKSEFTDRFKGASDEARVDEVDGVTSATFSSRAVKKSIKMAMHDFNRIKAAKEGGKK